MRHANALHQSEIHCDATPLILTDYQLAVLCTLFQREDSSKVSDLAQQWGYQHDQLQAFWCELHGSPTSAAQPAIKATQNSAHN